MHTGSYVQVRYPGYRRWATVAVSDNRAVAARFAADAFLARYNANGELPTQVRVVSAAQLVYEGGEHEVRIADIDVISGIGGAFADGLDEGTRPEAPGPTESRTGRPAGRHGRGVLG
jgi:hypothetical protein